MIDDVQIPRNAIHNPEYALVNNFGLSSLQGFRQNPRAGFTHSAPKLLDAITS
jgi:hypothetical protein